MSSTPPTERPVPYVRFPHGSFECTVVSDGILEMGAARVNFPTANPEDIDALLTVHYLPTENVRLNQNVLIVNTGDQLIQFDSGVGIDPELGRGFFGPKTGQAIPNLRASGIDPADIDIVAITHTHPDHVWGLVDAEGTPLYPNASIAVSREDFEYWTDLSRIDSAPNEHMKDHFRGAHKNLMPYADSGRIIWVRDGSEIAPGITAVATPGHSPGHIVYKVESDGDTMITWGDLCHHQVLLLQHPEWGFQFDYEQKAATAQRWRIYDLVESNRYSVLAYHFPFPGLGHLKKDGGGYAWLPSEIELRLPPETIALLAH
ncbi:MBL fold metallo-hydrolase [Arthrobacter sp. efr-133-TYG-118]|uniref:MBL fold metallo-hydrolase n=1 Tax=Arthrobacter sp. efr-133-TYG-118 TaxID=3040279 RepID=UPI00254D536A|nr:MBL fold metallo-hydrolase [Arthrobacter sp. efr-133-TYG-118]